MDKPEKLTRCWYRARSDEWYRSITTLKRAIRVQATVQRAVDIWKKLKIEQTPHEVFYSQYYKNDKKTHAVEVKYRWLHSKELYRARMALIRAAQMEAYPDTYGNLSKIETRI
jgi:hypothetical protein